MSTETGTHDPVEDSRASFIEHLTELRNRIVIILIAVTAGFAISWMWIEEIFTFLLIPLQDAARANKIDIDSAQMYHRSLTEHFFVLLKTGVYSGILLTIPVSLYQLWKFIAPGLYPDERKVVVPFVVMSTLCFLFGSAFCYYLIMPYAYGFLLGFADNITKPQLMMTEYLDLSVKLILAFGAVFEMPIVTTLLARIGIINYKMMLDFWRYAVVLCFIFGAMLTPPDLISQLLLAGPMMVLYFISVGCAYLFGRPPAEPTPPEEAASTP